MDALETIIAAKSDSADWIRALRCGGATAEEAVGRLREVLLEAARFEVARRRSSTLAREEIDEIARRAAEEALESVTTHLDDFRGQSRFTTWASKFAVVEAAVQMRQRAWLNRELPVERQEPLDAIREIDQAGLTPHERRVFVALSVDGVPIDVLAHRLDTTRGAVYETLRQARQKLRQHVDVADLAAA